MIELPELFERLQRIAGRAGVDHETAIRALIRKAHLGVASLTDLTDDQHRKALAVARRWDDPDDDAGDPDAEELRRWAAHWEEPDA